MCLVIHEFDPWFNFRAAQYLAAHGYEKFFKWYDYMSWSPLGRPVGTTIYPGMQFAAVGIWNVLNRVMKWAIENKYYVVKGLKKMKASYEFMRYVDIFAIIYNIYYMCAYEQSTLYSYTLLYLIII